MNLLRSLFGGMLSAVWQTAKEYHYGKAPDRDQGQDDSQAQGSPTRSARRGQLPAPDASGRSGYAAADASSEGSPAARKVTAEDAMVTLALALPHLRLGQSLSQHHADCVFPKGCNCIPAITAPLSRC
jgi:hypothetical protein